MYESIDRNIVILGWVSFFTDMASAMINPILPIFIITVLHEGYDKLGIIVAIATFLSYALRLVSGYISDRYGIVKPLVAGGYALSAISKPLLCISHGWQSVALLRGAERLGKGVRSAPKDLLIASYAKEKAAGRTFGFHKTLDIAGELGGTLLLFGALFLFGQNENTMRALFLATLIPGLIGLILILFFVKDVAKKERQKVQKFHLTSRDRYVAKSLLPYFGFIFFVFSEAFFTMQASSIGIETVMIPLLFVVSTLTQTLTSYRLGIWIDKAGSRRVMLFAYMCALAAQLLLYAKIPSATWLAYAFFGLFTVASLNASRTFIAKESINKGSLYGVFYAGIALFGAAGAFVSGMLWEHLGMDAVLLFSLGGTLLMLLLFLKTKPGDAYKS
jgi:MFS family permease